MDLGVKSVVARPLSGRGSPLNAGKVTPGCVSGRPPSDAPDTLLCIELDAAILAAL